MEQSYKLEFEDVSGNKIPHYDEASNIKYNNTGTKLNSGTVQNAITELSSNSAIKLLEDYEDYQDSFCDPTLQEFTLPELTISEYIYYESDTEVDWTADSNADLNPANWNARVFTKYFIPSGITGWKALTTSTPETTKEYVYVSVRRRSVYDRLFEGYSSPVLLSEVIASFDETTPNDITDVRTSSQYNALKEEFNTVNETQLVNARNTRLFLQSVLDNALADTTIVFPKDKTFVIDFNPSGYFDGFEDVRRTYNIDLTQLKTSSGAFDTYWFKTAFNALVIHKKVHIDLNGSTIRQIPNWLTNGTIIDVTPGYYFNTRPANTPDPTGTIIENGKVLGGTKFWFPDPGSINKEYEDASAISVNAGAVLKNVDCGEVSGDGMSISSLRTGTGLTLYNGELNSSGVVISNTKSKYCDFVSIASLNAIHLDRYNIVARPLVYKPQGNKNKEYNSIIDIAPYYIGETINVSYYNAKSESSFISRELLRFGDNFNVPEGANYIRCSFAVDTDKSYDQSIIANPPLIQLYLFLVNWAYDVTVEDCSIHDCVRDGLTLGSMPNGVIKNTTIKNCVQQLIDLESVSYLDEGIVLENITLGKESKGISAVTGSHLIVRNSKLSVLQIPGPQVVISDSDFNTLRSGPINESTAQKTFNANISRPRRVVRDTIIRSNSMGVNTLYENCIFSGVFDIWQGSRHIADYPNVYNHCTIKTSNLGPGVYEDCIIQTDDVLRLDVYYQATTHESKFIFRNCKIECAGIADYEQIGYSTNNLSTADKNAGEKHGPVIYMEDCTLVLNDTYKYKPNPNLTDRHINFNNCWFGKLVNNTIKFNPNGKSSDTLYKLLIRPYGNLIVERNVFEALYSSSRIRLIRMDLEDAKTNNSNFISITKNTVRTHKNLADNTNTFVNVKALDDQVDTDVVATKNTFICVDDNTGDATNVLIKTNSTGVTNNLITLESTNSKAINSATPIEYTE